MRLRSGKAAQERFDQRRLPDAGLADDHDRAPTLPWGAGLGQHRDLTIAADQGLLGVGGEDRRQPDVGRRTPGLASWRIGIVDLLGRDALALRAQHQLTPAQA